MPGARAKDGRHAVVFSIASLLPPPELSWKEPLVPGERLENPMKTFPKILLVLGLSAVAAASAEGQLNLTGGVSYAEALEGQWGIDARLGLDLPMLPIGVFGGADYFFAGCSEECSLWGWRAGAVFRFATPVFQPYLTGAYVGRKWEVGNEELDRTGLSMGAGIRMGLKIRIQAEANREFLGGDLDQWVFRIGLGL